MKGVVIKQNITLETPNNQIRPASYINVTYSRVRGRHAAKHTVSPAYMQNSMSVNGPAALSHQRVHTHTRTRT